MAAQPNLIAAAEYLRGEVESAVRHEYVGGRVTAMAGASRAHNELVSALASAFAGRLAGGECRSFGSDVKVQVPELDAYFYPDLTVACPPNWVDDAHGVIDNPTVVVEVLSPGTEARDRGEKFAAYRRLASLREYVLVASEAVRVEVFARAEGGRWTVAFHEGGSAVARLAALDLDLPLADLYRHVPSPARSDDPGPTSG